MKNIFIRTEKKYLLNEMTYYLFLNEIKKYMVVDKYGKQIINNIYYDDAYDQIINRSLENKSFKEKLRIRYYGNLNPDNIYYLELKRKLDGIVYKRRIELSFAEIHNYLENIIIQKEDDSLTKREIDNYIFRNNAYPKTFLSYTRIAFISNIEDGLRITIDSNIIYKHDHDIIKSLFEGKHFLIEIKTPNMMPLWLSNFLTKNKIFPTSFSKYGNIYKTIASNKEAFDV